MFRLLLLFLIVGVAAAWTPVAYRNLQASTSLKASRVDGDDGKDTDGLSRRNVLSTAFAAASLTFLPSAALSKDSRSSSPSPWPYAPSPLPSSARTPAELSSIYSYSSVAISLEGDDPLASFGAELSSMKTIAPSSTVVNATGLNQAIDESSKKKRIDPRTHG